MEILDVSKVKQLIAEIIPMRICDHPNLVKLYGVAFEQQ